MAHIVENAVIFKKILICAADTDLIGKSPDYDRGVVIILRNELLHLRNGILAAAGHMLGDIGNLRPDDQAVLIAQIVEILVVLIVSQTDGGGAQFVDEFHILLVVLGQQGVAQTPAVLVTGHATQGIFLAIEDKSTLRVDLKCTATKSCAYVIDYLFIAKKLCLCCVKIRVLKTMPKCNSLYFKANLSVLGYER